MSPLILVLIVHRLHLHQSLVNLRKQFLFLPRHASAAVLSPVLLLQVLRLLKVQEAARGGLVASGLGHVADVLATAVHGLVHEGGGVGEFLVGFFNLFVIFVF